MRFFLLLLLGNFQGRYTDRSRVQVRWGDKPQRWLNRTRRRSPEAGLTRECSTTAVSSRQVPSFLFSSLLLFNGFYGRIKNGLSSLCCPLFYLCGRVELKSSSIELWKNWVFYTNVRVPFLRKSPLRPVWAYLSSPQSWVGCGQKNSNYLIIVLRT